MGRQPAPGWNIALQRGSDGGLSCYICVEGCSAVYDPAWNGWPHGTLYTGREIIHRAVSYRYPNFSWKNSAIRCPVGSWIMKGGAGFILTGRDCAGCSLWEEAMMRKGCIISFWKMPAGYRTERRSRSKNGISVFWQFSNLSCLLPYRLWRYKQCVEELFPVILPNWITIYQPFPLTEEIEVSLLGTDEIDYTEGAASIPMISPNAFQMVLLRAEESQIKDCITYS